MAQAHDLISKPKVTAQTTMKDFVYKGTGIVDEVVSAVTMFKKGDHVLISCVSSCGKCEFCRKQMYSHCVNVGWILGNTIDGTQADDVLTPFVDTSLYPIPTGADEEALVMLSAILPTDFECGVLNGHVQPGGTVAIVGAGPVGLAALLKTQFDAPSEIIMIDLDDNRLATALAFGATKAINSSDVKAVEMVMKNTRDRGVDTAIEAVGVPATFEMCQKLVVAGGRIANIGVHGSKVDLHLETLWDRNIAITTRLVDTVTIPMLFRTVQAGTIDPSRLITHHFKMTEIAAAYEAFGNAAKTKALRVIISA